MFAQRIAWKLGACLLAVCAGGPAAAADPSVVFLADSQMHNIYGGEVKQTWGISDFFSGVAQRYPEMNLLAPHVLRDFIERGEDKAGPTGSPFVVMLGDATNAACTGEYERFMRAAKAGKPDRLVLMAHGNHDSYLMGTVNYWQPLIEQANLSLFERADLPVDATWWPQLEQKEGKQGYGWLALCYQSRPGESVPMHKIQWMAKYLRSLEAPGLQLRSESADEKKAVFSGIGKPGSLLESLNYDVKGEWIRPTKEAGGMRNTYRSFLVQAVDVGTSHRLILVDTAACGTYRRGWWLRWIPEFFIQNAGYTACMLDPQIDVIRDLARKAKDKGRTVVFAGHHPLKDFQSADRAAFETAMREASGDAWVYVSAHTHDPYTNQPRGNGARELNISSTTDWPMNASLIRFGKQIERDAVERRRTTIAYKPPGSYPSGPQLCRHLDAALQLQGVKLGETSYASPGNTKKYEDCIEKAERNWVGTVQELQDAEREIERRMGEADGKYREQVLGIMAGASDREHESFSLDKIKVR